MEKMIPRRALISVSDKSGLELLAKRLIDSGVQILSTGGTGEYLKKHKIPFTTVESVTGNPEAFGGRMKTISFQVGSALLFRRNHPQDLQEARDLGIEAIDLVVCNLYPFQTVAQKASRSEEELIENIDVGGPQMIRAAAKNCRSVCVLTDPADYTDYIHQLDAGGSSLESRKQMAIKAFSLTARYDFMIALHLAREWKFEIPELFSDQVKALRYGENPHQKARLSIVPNFEKGLTSLASAPILQGKEVSYNNYLDADQAYKCVSELAHLFPEMYHVVIVKHGIPCGVASSSGLETSLIQAWESDSVSAFGGVLAFSGRVDENIAKWLSSRFVEVIVAPQFSAEALEMFSSKRNLRLIELPLKPHKSQEWCVRTINGGILWQEEDEWTHFERKEVTKERFDSAQLDLLRFGQTVVKYLKSNCLLLATLTDDGFTTVASGVGQPNRLDCLSLIIKPKIDSLGVDIGTCVLFSDAFFPFRDSIDAAHQLGVKYIVQPGGSIKDQEVIEACDEKKIAMVFTAVRHFRH
jgi:phosphoribosylaminoimidazolecarboxamide formyltransferase/IMP cyclohydrolase